MSTSTVSILFNASTISVSVVVLVMLAKIRPDTNDAKNMALIAECFKTIKPTNFVVIFNKASKKYTAEKAIAFFEKICKDAGIEKFV